VFVPSPQNLRSATTRGMDDGEGGRGGRVGTIWQHGIDCAIRRGDAHRWGWFGGADDRWRRMGKEDARATDSL
jgi:hypothetical protein